MQNVIGDCINGEDWLEFRGPSGFVGTFVDRNYCGPHSVHRYEGSMSVLPDRVVAYTLTTEQETRSFAFTSTVLDPAPPGTFPPVPPPDPPYVYGNRAYAPFAFSRDASGAYVRTEHVARSTLGPSPTTVTTDVNSTMTVTPAPANAKAGDACMMHLEMTAAVSYDADPSPKKLAFDIECAWVTEPSGWLAILPKGKKPEEAGTFWYDLLQSKGVAKLGHAGDALYAGFVPHLLRVPARPDVLVMPRGWYREMLQSPPTSAN